MEQMNFGVAPSRFDLRDYKLKIKKGIATATYYPEQFELKMPKIKMQGKVGSCVAHSLATVIEYYNLQETNEYKEMSTAYIYGNRRNSSWKKPGMRTRDALKNACEYGDIEKALLPDNIEVPNAITYFEKEGAKYKEQGKINRIKKFFKIDSENALKEYLMSTGPALVVMKYYNRSIIELPGYTIKAKGNSYDLHCVVCYGWNKYGWKIQNSWGFAWGRRGIAIQPYENKFVEMWGLIDEENSISKNTEVVAPYSGIMGDTIAKGINAVLNFITGRK